MANEKISQLPIVTSTAGADLYPIVQGGTNVAIEFINLQTSIASALTSSQLPGITLAGMVTGGASAGYIPTIISNSVITNAMFANLEPYSVKANLSASPAEPTDASLGTVTENISSVLTLTGWTNATIGSPTVQVKQATASQSGYLSFTDWNTFNDKSSSGNFATSGSGDVSWSAPSGPGSVDTHIVATSNATLTTLSALSLPTTQLSGYIVLESQVSGVLPVANATLGPVTLTESGGGTTVDWTSGNLFLLTLSANLTVTFSGATAGQVIIVELTNTSSNYTVTWPTVKWTAGTAPTQTGGAVTDVYTFVYNGSTYTGSVVPNTY